MLRASALIFTLSVLAVPAQAQVFRCEKDGNTVFADQPCGEDAESVELRDNRIGGSFNQNLPAQEAPDPQKQAEEPEPEEEAGSCRFINSTDLRRYLVREQVVRGMTREHVRRAFGNPPETYTSPQEVWIYQTRYYGALYELTYVYFRDGCVERVEYRKP
ncbi:hypothetical protein KEHDKFFH_06590 [Marinobacter maroccanus]|uniref:DUF4124 domain-containing protein n=1 Tax=Marinobacter maroccanus TaxID=2055143 RepID=A0A2S5ZBV9_9GAMM|nr:DUF4124 domain-containing protein [Marinobacter maroccanus]PPI84870.1 hypothetical protein KEHDKFFH_06590 [Marinobacter maroccanus]